MDSIPLDVGNGVILQAQKDHLPDGKVVMTATVDDTDIFGVGTTDEEALADLKEQHERLLAMDLDDTLDDWARLHDHPETK